MGSVGRFNIVASTSLEGRESPFYLGAAVMAGDVYGTGILPRSPPYFFIWATDGRISKVFRINKQHSLTVENRSESAFAEVKLSLRFREAEKVQVDTLISQGSSSENNLVCRIALERQVCEFPVVHLNALLPGSFQVETGPIIALVDEQLLPAFVFFNSTTTCQLVEGYPALTGKVRQYESRIEFFSYA